DRVLLHHPAQGAHPGRQAETLETGTNLLPGFANRCLWKTARGLSTLVHGVALLCGFDTPSLPAQGGQRRLESFNTRRDIPVPDAQLDVSRWPVSDRRHQAPASRLAE